MLTRILSIGLLAGAIAGTAAAVVQSVLMQPLIVEAEQLETGRALHDEARPLDTGARAHDAENDEEPPDDPLGRRLATAGAIVCTGIGYGLVLSGMLALGRRRGWRFGLLLGTIGFVSMQLAPAFGTPPQPPGLPAHDVHVRQLWWLLAAGCTSAACFAAAHGLRARRATLLALAAALLALPHVVRRWLADMGPVPEPGHWATPFVLGSLATAAVLWLCLGTVAGALHARPHRR